MPYVSEELKSKISDFLAGQAQPVRVWDIAHAIGYSADQTRHGLNRLIDDKTVERIGAATAYFSPRHARVTQGFTQNRTRPAYRYQLRHRPAVQRTWHGARQRD
jgi:predicted ArsR family transcriptional regulator